MRDLFFPSPPALTDALRESTRASAAAFVAEVKTIAQMYLSAPRDQQEFVPGEVACALHLAPASGFGRLATALSVVGQPVLLAALERGRLGVPHALALLSEVAHLDAPHAAAVLTAVLVDGDDPDSQQPVESTPGELRAAGVHGRPAVDGMAQVVIDCTATEMATALAAVKARAAAMSFTDPEPGQAPLTQGQREVAAFLHALGCGRTHIQAVIECPVDAAVDLQAVAHAPVWTVDVRMPAAVALGLSDHPAVLTGYGPIGADQARALLPAADLVRACVDSVTGEVLAVDPPVRVKTWQAGLDTRARALRDALVTMATSGGTRPDLSTDGYVPSQALGRLVDLRDVTSVFPGDSTPARRCDRDHRLPYPLGPTSETNMQNAGRRWHRAKHNGWHTHLLPDGTIRWTSPTGGVYHRRPKRTPPPPIPPGATLPPLPEPEPPDDR